MSAAFDIDILQDFVEDLCTKNTDVQHTVGGLRCFARFQSNDHINEIRNNGGPNLVLVLGIGGRRVGSKEDYRLRRELGLRFACYASDSTSEKKN